MAEPTDDATTRATQKQETLEKTLEVGRVQIRLDARRPGVRVPEKFADEPMLALNLSWRFPQTEMVINERGVAATLRFDSVPSRCVIPWSALFAIIPTTGEPTIWPLDVPAEFGGPPSVADAPVPLPVEPVRPKLSVVSGGTTKAIVAEKQSEELQDSNETEESQPQEASAEPTEPASVRAPWLRIVR